MSRAEKRFGKFKVSKNIWYECLDRFDHYSWIMGYLLPYHAPCSPCPPALEQVQLENDK